MLWAQSKNILIKQDLPGIFSCKIVVLESMLFKNVIKKMEGRKEFIGFPPPSKVEGIVKEDLCLIIYIHPTFVSSVTDYKLCRSKDMQSCFDGETGKTCVHICTINMQNLTPALLTSLKIDCWDVWCFGIKGHSNIFQKLKVTLMLELPT